MTIRTEKMNMNTGDYNSVEIEYNAEKKAEVEEAARKLAVFMPTMQKQNPVQEKKKVVITTGSGYDGWDCVNSSTF